MGPLVKFILSPVVGFTQIAFIYMATGNFHPSDKKSVRATEFQRCVDSVCIASNGDGGCKSSCTLVYWSGFLLVGFIAYDFILSFIVAFGAHALFSKRSPVMIPHFSYPATWSCFPDSDR